MGLSAISASNTFPPLNAIALTEGEQQGQQSNQGLQTRNPDRRPAKVASKLAKIKAGPDYGTFGDPGALPCPQGKAARGFGLRLAERRYGNDPSGTE